MMGFLRIQHRPVREALGVRLSQPWRRAAIRFDDENLVSCAGLVPVMQLAEDTGLHELVADAVQIDDPPIPSTGVNPAGKISSIVAGMAAGADSIDDLDVLRHGGMPSCSAGCTHPRHSARSCARSRGDTRGSCPPPPGTGWFSWPGARRSWPEPTRSPTWTSIRCC